jgi:hypothetical protein
MRISIAVPAVQLALYAALIVAGDLESRHRTTPLEMAAPAPVFFDIAYGLNFPVVLPGFMAASAVWEGGSLESTIWIQVWLGCLVPLLWLIVVRWYVKARKRIALARPTRLAGRRPVTFNPLQRNALILSALAVVTAVVWAIKRPEHWIVKVFAVAWIAVAIFMWMARRSRWADPGGP